MIEPSLYNETRVQRVPSCGIELNTEIGTNLLNEPCHLSTRASSDPWHQLVPHSERESWKLIVPQGMKWVITSDSATFQEWTPSSDSITISEWTIMFDRTRRMEWTKRDNSFKSKKWFNTSDSFMSMERTKSTKRTSVYRMNHQG